MQWLAFVQWPAMLVTVAAAWLTGSRGEQHRRWGFWTFFLSNALWIAWGIYAHAWALIVLQLFLIVTNVRGAKKNE